MSVWSSETLGKRLPKLVEGFDHNRVKNGAYELSLGAEYYTTESKRKTFVRPKDTVTISPGQMALLITEECIEIPADAMGLISIRSKYKLQGLINVSGFHVDPGFNGKLIFAVYNAGAQSVVMLRGDRAFSIWFIEFDTPTKDIYSGSKNGQENISSDDIKAIAGNIVSPATLNSRLETLEKQFKIAIGIAVTLVASLILPIATTLAIDWLNSRSDHRRTSSLNQSLGSPTIQPPSLKKPE